MKITHSFVVAAATFNLAIGAPIAEQKSRAVVVEDAVRRAAENNPYLAIMSTADAQPRSGSDTPMNLRSVLSALGRRSFGRLDKRYRYKDTPIVKSVEDLNKRYSYKDSPWAKSVEDLDKRYSYKDSPWAKSVEDLDKRYRYGSPDPGIAEDLNQK
ncbi:hypothetical protein ACQRIU_000256 [Beauveria bassiana]